MFNRTKNISMNELVRRNRNLYIKIVNIKGIFG